EVRFAVELLDGGQLLRLPEDGSLPGPEVLAPATAGHGKGLLGAPAAGALLLPLLLAAAVVGRRRRA
ncbi:MAG: hypothetical protein QOI63_561, partial [Thermoplasmata archaeon]|nr:hypothetical protein [Thermoplasmata archaeon]